MKFRQLLALSISLFSIGVAQAQITPEQIPLDTTHGGSGASKQALAKLGDAAGDIKTLRNIDGPSEGRDRKRTFINQYPVEPSDLSGIENYFMRSSYVTLGPKGFAPLHPHADRPAFLQVVDGTIHQHRSDGVSLIMGVGDFTFSSDSLAHWWSNDSAEQPTTLWIVELCTDGHGCETEVKGGAKVLPNKSEAKPNTGPAPLVALDLAGEFLTAGGFGNRHFNLRRHDVSTGETFDVSSLGSNPTYVRIFDGNLVSKSDGSLIEEGSVFLTDHGGRGEWRNHSDETVTLYSIELER